MATAMDYDSAGGGGSGMELATFRSAADLKKNSGTGAHLQKPSDIMIMEENEEDNEGTQTRFFAARGCAAQSHPFDRRRPGPPFHIIIAYNKPI